MKTRRQYRQCIQAPGLSSTCVSSPHKTRIQSKACKLILLARGRNWPSSGSTLDRSLHTGLFPPWLTQYCYCLLCFKRRSFSKWEFLAREIQLNGWLSCSPSLVTWLRSLEPMQRHTSMSLGLLRQDGRHTQNWLEAQWPVMEEVLPPNKVEGENQLRKGCPLWHAHGTSPSHLSLTHCLLSIYSINKQKTFKNKRVI